MNSLQTFTKTLSQKSRKTPDFQYNVGDCVFVQNAYGRWLDQGVSIIGFDKSQEERNWIYLNWECYWVGKNPSQIVPEKCWKQRSWVARVYSVNAGLFQSLNLQREYNVVVDWDNPFNESDQQLITHSTEFFRWDENDGRSIFLVHNQMAFHFWKKEIAAASEPEYYEPICPFSKNATVVLTLNDLGMLERVGLENINTPALAKLTTFVETARDEIANGNIVYYRAF